MSSSAEALTRGAPPAFKLFTESVINIKFDEEPKYAAFRRLFEPLCGTAGVNRPVLTEFAARLAALKSNGRESDEDGADGGLGTSGVERPNKKVFA